MSYLKVGDLAHWVNNPEILYRVISVGKEDGLCGLRVGLEVLDSEGNVVSVIQGYYAKPHYFPLHSRPKPKTFEDKSYSEAFV